MKIKILEEAESDLLRGYQFYEEQKEGVGDEFLESIFEDLESLSEHAGIHPKKFGFYRLLASKFPYAVYYQIEDNVVFVFAVLDCRRNPDWIKERLDTS